MSIADLSMTVGTTTTIADAGEYNAFGGGVRCANGDIVIAWRRSAGHAGEGPAIFRRSTDNGATWGAEYTPLTATSILWGGMGMMTHSDGRVFLSAWTDDGGAVGRVLISDDHAATFDTEATVTHGFTGYGVSESPVVELPDGTLLLAVWGRDSDEGATSGSAKVLRSTDDGATFASAVTPSHGPTWSQWFNESGIGRLPNASLMLVTRSETAPAGYWHAMSGDNGLTWSTQQRVHEPTAVRYTGYPKVTQLPDIGTGCVGWLARDPLDSDAPVVVLADTNGHWMTSKLATAKMMYGQLIPNGTNAAFVVWFDETSTTVADAYFTAVTFA